ncbi:unnamed protein product, partial [Oppiella nova]
KNVWEIAIELAESQTNYNKDSTLVVVGSKQGGKTSLIYRFIDKTDAPKPTVALEYTYGRKHKENDSSKQVCNVWELGGGVMFTNLIEFAISIQSLERTSLVIVIDLSAPEELIITIETLLNSIRDHISKILSDSYDKNLNDRLKEKSMNRIGKQNEDIQQIIPFLIPIVIMGTKYDIFQNLDPEKQKLIVRYLRLISHTMGAQLIFVSTKSEALMVKSRTVLNALAFKTPIDSLGFQSDYRKPIAIPFGSDSFKKIGAESIDAIKRTYIAIFPQMVTQVVIPDDPAKDINFKERDIDLIRAQRDSELEDYKRQPQLKQQ